MIVKQMVLVDVHTAQMRRKCSIEAKQLSQTVT